MSKSLFTVTGHRIGPVVLLMLLSFSVMANPEPLYQQHCASCHAPNRLGAMGPALLPGNLKRLKKNEAAEVIRQGRPATQMPGFSDKLNDEQIAALVEYIYTPLPELPSWGEAEIEASHQIHYRQSELSDTPVFDADPLNLFMVVELGDHHATVLDGDKFEPIHRFETHFALHGGPKYSPSGRYVYFASRDGWISKFDMYNLKTVAEIRAGINTRNLAVSADGRYVMVGNYLPHTLVLLDAKDLSPIRIFGVRDKQGRSSRVSAVYTAPPRGSFVAALKDVKEVWEISYLDEPEPVATGYMHDYRYEEGYMDRGPFPLRRIMLDDYLDDFFFDQSYKHLIGAARNANNGQVINMIVGRKIAEVDLQGLPHLGSGISWEYQGRRVLATPNLKKGEVSVIDMQTWETVKTIKTHGPGFFMRSHKNSPYAWVDVFFGPHHDEVHIIDKSTLEIVKTLKPVPGKTAAHVEFDRDGRHALLSIWDKEGYVIVYDAKTLEEVKRLPMNKPSGKYNVYNKTRYTEGTSH
ncbi:MAG: cytochrome D1 domain-containing protein [Thiohalophilus sp.]|uniref:cytochrome D1 domain-containing protein n=1 Tax=Thiohalophilus sp. TaxID=3028392 RepID=UPI00286FF2AD|nr:cytochrome D1 domain-containing protein [Thiohalophilus sp.]